MALTIDVPRDEWEAARRLACLVEPDEREDMGQVRVQSDGVRRRWYATDGVCAAILASGADSARYDFGVSPALLGFAETASRYGDAALRAETLPGGGRVGVSAGERQMWTTDLGHDYPDVDAQVPADDDLMAQATVEMRALHETVSAARMRREGASDDDEDGPDDPDFWLEISGTEVSFHVEWPNCGPTDIAVTASNVVGKVVVRLNPYLLQSLIELFAPTDEIEIRVPTWATRPIAMVAGDLTTLLMPMQTEALVLRGEVEEIIEDLFGPLAVIVDADGDYPLMRHTIPVFGRLLTAVPTPVLQVFAVLLRDVTDGPELWKELNDLNANTTFARIFHVDGQILAEVDLVAATLDEDELSVAVARIREIATTIIPTLAAVLGGSVVEDPFATRLRTYRAAVIEAELLPGQLHVLNGPGAISEWPFPGPVYVMTGWNPQGASLGEIRHGQINTKIGQDIIGRGGRFVHGCGRSPSGDHSEPSLIAWDILRDDAIDIGRRASQDSVFEIDDDEVRLISCFDGTVDTWPRHPRAVDLT